MRKWFVMLFLLCVSPCWADGLVIGWPTGEGGGGEIVFNGITTSSTVDNNYTIHTTQSLTVGSNDLIVCYVWASKIPAEVACGENILTQANKVSLNDPFHFIAYYKSGATAYNGTCETGWFEDALWKGMACANYSGVATTSALDKSTCNTAGCDAVSVTSTSLTAQNTATTAQANELLIGGVLRYNNDADFTQVSPYTFRGNDGTLFGLFDAEVSATGTYPGQSFGTTSDSDTYLSIFTTFKGQ